MLKKKFNSNEEDFWAGEFGNAYIQRNDSKELLASNLYFFSNALRRIEKIKSCIEFGANIGMNLQAIKLLMPNISAKAIEINTKAAKQLSNFIGQQNVYNGSIYSYPIADKFDLSLIKGVLIHINPDMLNVVYDKLYNCTNKYILIAEYYNPSPVSVIYRGHADRLHKRDFAGEMLEFYNDLKLIDYGFTYKRDPLFPQDDITWFLLQKS